MFSDGYIDQFGGENGKKLGYKNFRDKLIELSSLDIEKQKSDLFQKIQNTNELIDLLNGKIRSAQQLVVSQNFNGQQMLLLKYRQVTRHLNEILLLSLIHKETKKENENWNDKDFSRELQHFGEYFVKIKKSLQEAVQENTSKDELYFVQKSGINYIEDFREEFKI